MGTVTNISGEDLEVSLLDHRIVKAGDSVDVDDDLLHAHDDTCGDEKPGTSTRAHCDKHGYVWPEANWKTSAPARRKSKTDLDAAAAGTQE